MPAATKKQNYKGVSLTKARTNFQNTKKHETQKLTLPKEKQQQQQQQ